MGIMRHDQEQMRLSREAYTFATDYLEGQNPVTVSAFLGGIRDRDGSPAEQPKRRFKVLLSDQGQPFNIRQLYVTWLGITGHPVAWADGEIVIL